MPTAITYRVCVEISVEQLTHVTHDDKGTVFAYKNLHVDLPLHVRGEFATDTEAIKAALTLAAQIEVDADCLTERSE